MQVCPGSAATPLPSGFTSPLYVYQPSWQPQAFWVFESWPVLYGGTLPAAGADVLVARDDAGHLRCVWWAGTYTPPPYAATAGVLA